MAGKSQGTKILWEYYSDSHVVHSYLENTGLGWEAVVEEVLTSKQK